MRLTNPTVYEVYVRSFNDTTGSGEGDLNGVIERLGYIRDLGVDAIWIAPFYPSPMDDGGYDVSNHRAIDPRYGTMDDFDRLIETAHDRELAVCIDLVFNHTSTAHPWFQAALDGDDDAARRYVFCDPKPDGTAPNNWLSYFGPPAWTWSHRRRQYYFHQFLACQPSLDLRNEEVQADHEETCRFWCARGVDGFRMDAVTAYLFDPSLKDNPPASPEVSERVAGPAFSPYTYQDHEYDMLPGDGGSYVENVRRWAGDDKWLLGECNSGNRSIEIAREFVSPHRLNATYTTDLHDAGASPATIFDMLDRMEGDWTVPWWISCHDQARGISALGDGDAATSRFFATLLATLPGSLLIYQGDELALPQPTLEKSEVTDPFDLLYWPDGPGREGSRVPMPWLEGSLNKGFTAGNPWLPMRWPDNIAADIQANDAHSTLTFWRFALATRRQSELANPRTFDYRADGDRLILDMEANTGRYNATFNFGAPTTFKGHGETLLQTGVEDERFQRWGARLSRI